MTSVIGRLANYDGGMVPNAELETIEDDVSEKGGKKAKPGKVRMKIPCTYYVLASEDFNYKTWYFENELS